MIRVSGKTADMAPKRPVPAPIEEKQFRSTEEIDSAILKIQRRIKELEDVNIQFDVLNRAGLLRSSQVTFRRPSGEIFGINSPESRACKHPDIWAGPIHMGMNWAELVEGKSQGRVQVINQLKSLIRRIMPTQGLLKTIVVRTDSRKEIQVSLFSELKKNVEPGPYFEDDGGIVASTNLPVRLVAYFLPQFHRIPENDLWWGKGFTDWTNVTKSYPRFPGHYQPHLPGELGFYDLSDPEILYRQAALARRYGVHGFCIHHYWFGGKRLLEKPLKNLLDHPEIDIQFCLNWANDNWSRRWDGSEHEILLLQKHSPEDDIALAQSLEAALADRRYIRINGRPLLMIYRPGLLTDARATVERWRTHFVRAGLGDPYIIMPQAFGAHDPKEFGMDAAAGFPPHHSGFDNAPLRRWTRLLSPRHKSIIRSYDAMVRRALANRPDFTYFPGVCPSWDNHARRQKGGQVFVGSTPQKYGEWLRGACEYVLSHSASEERLVFVNAWNEWAEGTHLEPDRYYGYAFLAETARVLNALPSRSTSLSEPQSRALSVPTN